MNTLSHSSEEQEVFTTDQLKKDFSAFFEGSCNGEEVKTFALPNNLSEQRLTVRRAQPDVYIITHLDSDGETFMNHTLNLRDEKLTATIDSNPMLMGSDVFHESASNLLHNINSLEDVDGTKKNGYSAADAIQNLM